MLSREGKGEGVVTALLTTKKPITIWKKKTQILRQAREIMSRARRSQCEKTSKVRKARENMNLVTSGGKYEAGG